MVSYGKSISAWVSRNGYFIFLSIFLLIINQLVELLAIKLAGSSYADICLWDCKWYVDIVSNGYDAEPHAFVRGDGANWAFFPLLPILTKLLSTVAGLDSTIALILTGKLFFALAIFSFIRFGLEYDARLNPVLLGSLVALNPYSIYANAGYTEPAFLFFSCLFFIHLRRGNFIVAGLLGGLLTAVRVVGVFALLAYLSRAFAAFLQADARRKEHILLGFLLIPLGICLFIAFLHWRTGDGLAFMHIQRAWHRDPVSPNPLGFILAGFRGNLHQQYFAVCAVLALVAPLYFVFRKDFDLAVFSFFCTLAPLSSKLQSIPRYLWWQAPLLLLVALVISKGKLRFVALPVFVGGMIYIYLAWLSGEFFVV